MSTEEPKKPPVPGELDYTESIPRLRPEGSGSAAQELKGERVPTQEGVEDTVAWQKPEYDLVPTSTALQVYVPQMPVASTQGTVAVVRSRQEQLREAQQTLLKLMVDYTAIVLYLL